MTLKTKKIIAREGLIITLFVVIGVLLMVRGEVVYERVSDELNEFKEENNIIIDYFYQEQKWVAHIESREDTSDYSKAEAEAMLKALDLRQDLDDFSRPVENSLIVCFLGYLFSLLIRFIVWAIKTLRKKVSEN